MLFILILIQELNMSKKRQKIIHILVIVLLTIPLILMAICFVNLLYKNIMEFPDIIAVFIVSESVIFFAFILVCYSILLFSVIFFQKINSKKDFKSEELKLVNKEDNLSIDGFELLKIEAHECIMTACLLIEHKEYNWALAWTLRSLKLQIKLNSNRSELFYEFNSQDFIVNLKVIKYQLNSGQIDVDKRDDKKFISIRKWKDLFECISLFEDLRKSISDGNSSLIKGIKDVLDYALGVIIIQINITPNDEGLGYIESGMKDFNSQIFEKFQAFKRNPEVAQDVYYFLE